MRVAVGTVVLSLLACGKPSESASTSTPPSAPATASASASADAGANDAIGRLVAKLSSQPLWNNGTHPVIELPEKTPIPEVTARAIAAVSFDNGKITSHKLVETRTVQIDARSYTAVRLESNQGEKILLLRYDSGTWWSRFYPVS